MPNLSQKAIDAALSCKWKEAISINEEILKINSGDIATLNRLAYAYTQIGSITKAKKIYKEVLSHDQYNSIAQKNLNKINSLPKKMSAYKNQPRETIHLSPSLFIEEPGKTKTVVLTHLAPRNVLSKLRIGDTAVFCSKKHSIEVRDLSKTYLGALPDDISFRMMHFLKAGNTYHVCIKNIGKNSVSVFIKELKRDKRLHNQPTFTLCNHDYASSTPKELKRAIKEDSTVDETANQEESEE